MEFAYQHHVKQAENPSESETRMGAANATAGKHGFFRPKTREFPSKNTGRAKTQTVKNTEFPVPFTREVIIRVYYTDGSVRFPNSVDKFHK